MKIYIDPEPFEQFSDKCDPDSVAKLAGSSAVFVTEAQYNRSREKQVMIFVDFSKLPRQGVLGVDLTKIQNVPVWINASNIMLALKKLFGNNVSVCRAVRNGKACVYELKKTNSQQLYYAATQVQFIFSTLP
jgi:hypothetical protein